jgi:hypothetical protein
MASAMLAFGSHELPASLLRAMYSAETHEEYHLRKAAFEHTVKADRSPWPRSLRK